MDEFEEKNAIYEQMRLLLEERREITRAYFEMKKRLITLNTELEPKIQKISEKRTKIKNFKAETEYQTYISERKKKGVQTLSYSIISLKIAAILKEADRPLANKEIFFQLTENYKINISYKNLTHNILQRIQNDPKINVERAYRGYWQYRLR